MGQLRCNLDWRTIGRLMLMNTDLKEKFPILAPHVVNVYFDMHNDKYNRDKIPTTWLFEPLEGVWSST